MTTPRLHTPTWGRLDLPDGFAACIDCNELMTVDQLLEPCKGAAVPCECSDLSHGTRDCVPIPAQHVRYRIRTGGAGAEGLVMLCAHCYVNGHLAGYELTYQAHNRAEEIPK